MKYRSFSTGIFYDSWDRVFILIIYILYTIFYVEYYTLYKSVQSQWENILIIDQILIIIAWQWTHIDVK